MKYFLGLILLFTVAACGNSNDAAEKDPSVVQPPSDAIPDSIAIVGDSVLVPDVTPGNGKQVGKSDSIQQNKH